MDKRLHVVCSLDYQSKDNGIDIVIWLFLYVIYLFVRHLRYQMPYLKLEKNWQYSLFQCVHLLIDGIATTKNKITKIIMAYIKYSLVQK